MNPTLYRRKLCSLFRQSLRYYAQVTADKVELTSVRYKDTVKRGNFSSLNDDDISFFKKLIGANRVFTDPVDVEGHNIDWLHIVRGNSRLLLKPETTAEVSEILKFCNERKLAVCPQGGNTGLVGGSVPVYDEIILNTTLMDSIISLDSWSGVLVCEAGCILEKLNDFLMNNDLTMPLDLGAKGSCQIGGNVSTNAGGLRLLRYGSLHSTVLGVEAVLADGTIMDCMSSMKKDNTGYDLKHLFIGSEGTLGVVTKVAIHCPPKPKAINLAFLGLYSFENVLRVYKRAKQDLGEILSSCEYMDYVSVKSVTGNLHLNLPVAEFPFYMLIETSGSHGEHDEDKLNAFLEEVMAKEVVADGTLASGPGQMQAIWAIRERIAESLMHDGYVYKYDLSIPLTAFDELVQTLKQRLGPKAIRVCGYGHIGDGNIHLNVTTNDYDSDVTKLIEPFVYEWVSKRNGSVSAEHGIGFKKTGFLSFSKSAESIAMMQNIKKLFDPNGILNPYKVLPS